MSLRASLDPNVWVGNLEAVASEKVGIENVTYVSNISKYYIAYKLLTEQDEEKRKARESIEGRSP